MNAAFANIPQGLKNRPQWVVWKKETRNKKPTKVPYRAYMGQPPLRARADSKATWAAFEMAVVALETGFYDGIGFVFSDRDRFCGIDLDDAIDPTTGEVNPDAAEIVATLDSYTEMSPSGQGLHIIVAASLAELKGRRRGKVEMYEQGRFFTMTGDVYGAVRPVAKRQEQLEVMHKKFVAAARPAPKPATRRAVPTSATLEDTELLEVMFASTKGAEIKRLWDGDTSAYGGDASAADLALVSHLAWWCDYDMARVDALFRRSGLHRPKWDEKHQSDGRTYGQMTLDRAAEDNAPGDGYHGKAPGKTAAPKAADEQTGSQADEEEQKEPRKSQATELGDLVKSSSASFFHTPDDEPFMTAPVDQHFETYRLKSNSARAWLRRRYRDATGRSIGGQALQDALNDFEGIALFDGKKHEVHVRLAWHNGDIILDLGDDTHQVVRVTPNGWQLEANSPVKFIRPKALAPLPPPVVGGSLDELWKLLNISKDDRPLLTAWLVASLKPSGPYPPLALHGEQGSAKSTTARAVRALVDPSTAPLRSEPRDPRDLMIAATSSWVPTFDNLSTISPALSDALCILSTGGGYATRTLYANDEETILSAQRPVIMTAIADVATRPDLLDRCIILYLPRIKDKERRPESAFWKAFNAAHPHVLGALLSAVSAGLRRTPDIKLRELPRMADFALWAVACEEPFLPDESSFIKRYSANRADANELALDTSPLPAALRSFVEGQPEQQWKGTPTALLEALNKMLENKEDQRTPRMKEWPKRADKLSGALKRFGPNLRATGLEVDFDRTNNERTISLGKVVESGVTGVTSVTGSNKPRPERTNGGDATGDATSGRDASSVTGQSSVTTSVTGENPSGTAQMASRDASDASDAKKTQSSKRLWEGEI